MCKVLLIGPLQNTQEIRACRKAVLLLEVKEGAENGERHWNWGLKLYFWALPLLPTSSRKDAGLTSPGGSVCHTLSILGGERLHSSV